MTVEEAVQAEIMDMPPWAATSALAKTAIHLAQQLELSPPAYVASISRELRTTLDQLRTIVDKAPEEADPLDELAKRRVGRQNAQVQRHSAQSDDGGT